MEFEFDAVVWEWRGPAPYHFVTMPGEQAEAVREIAASVSYGWGMVPVRVQVGRTTWRTSMFAKDGGYVLPLRDSVRAKEKIAPGDVVSVRLVVGAR